MPSRAFVLATQSLEESEKAEKGSVTQGATPQLKYYRPHRAADVPKLVWAVVAGFVSKSSAAQREQAIVLVDAIDGLIVEVLPALAHAVN